MRSHSSVLSSRLSRKALTSICRCKIAAAGIDHRGRIINITTNRPRYSHSGGGYHAEELLLFSSPPSLSRIVVARVNRAGRLLPISPCPKCARLAYERGVTIEAAVAA